MNSKNVSASFIALLGFSIFKAVFAEEKINLTHRDPFFVSTSAGSQPSAPDTIYDYAISALVLKGVIVQADTKMAIVRAPNQRDYWLKVGDVIGSEHATVSQISAQHIQLAWQLNHQMMTAILNFNTE